MKPLLKIDMLIGAIIGAFWFWYIGLWVFVLAIIFGLLWAIGGQYGHTPWRSSIPFVLFIVLNLWSSIPFSLLTLISIWPCVIGYGLPTGGDKGSCLGNWCYKICGNSEKIATLFVRSIVIILIEVPFIIKLLTTSLFSVKT